MVDALTFLLENQDLTPDERLEGVIARIHGPDFPTAGFIMGKEGILSAYRTGRGSIVMRASAEIEARKGDRESIVITEIPYQVNKARLIEKIAELAREERIRGIQDVRDESDRQGMRVVVDVKKGEPAQVILNNLYKHTPLQDSFGVILLAIVDQRPRVLNLLDACELFIDFRREVVRRRTAFELRKAEARAHVLEGYVIALDHLDEVIALIRAARTPEIAKAGARSQRFALSEIQADEILKLQLSRLTGLERQKIEDELKELVTRIADLKDILAKPVAHRRDHHDRARGDPRDPRRSAPHRDRGRRQRDRGRGPDRRRGRGDLDHAHRLHQAHLDHHLPRAEARGSRARGDEDAGRGLRLGSLHRLDALLHPDLHRPRPHLLAEGARGPRRRARRARARRS